jgi:hypothetical protein
MQSRSTEELIRSALLLILAIGLVGTEVELLLLKHFDGVWQLIPVVLIGIAILATLWFALSKRATALRALELTMLVFVASGALGVVQHFNGNIEYAKDSNPSLAGAELYKEAVMGSTPTLAPGTMVQLGLVGLLLAFRHPVATQGSKRS